MKEKKTGTVRPLSTNQVEQFYCQPLGQDKGAIIFFGMGGGRHHNFRKYLGNIFVTPLFDDQKFYDPPPELQC